jgi:hypothetical protein
MAAANSPKDSTPSSVVLPLGVHFQTISQNESARRGKVVFTSSAKSVDTPNLILYTKKGSPINLTPDLLSKLEEANMLQISFQEMYEFCYDDLIRFQVSGCRCVERLQQRNSQVRTPRRQSFIRFLS